HRTAPVPFPCGQLSPHGAFCHKAHDTRQIRLADAKARMRDNFMAKRRKIVAIVEDDPSMLRATRDLLDAHGFATVAFASAEAFLARRTLEKVGCLLLDIGLGGMSGLELRRQLKVFR